MIVIVNAFQYGISGRFDPQIRVQPMRTRRYPSLLNDGTLHLEAAGPARRIPVDCEPF